MKKLRPMVKITEKTHTISPKRAIDGPLLKSLGWPGEGAVRMAFRPAIPLAKLPPVKLPAGGLCRLGCAAPAARLRYNGGPVPAAGIESRPPKSFAELKRVYRLANRSYLKTWGKKVARFYSAAAGDFEKKFLRKTRSLIMLRGGKPAAFYSLLKFDRGGKTFDLVAWHNAIGRLSPAELRSAWHQAAVWMSGVSRNRMVVGLDLCDKPSIKAFSGLGFRVTHVRVINL